MEKLLIIGLVITTVIYIAGHHFLNWAFRKIKDFELLIMISFGYIIFNGFYWIYVILVFKKIL